MTPRLPYTEFQRTPSIYCLSGGGPNRPDPRIIRSREAKHAAGRNPDP